MTRGAYDFETYDWVNPFYVGLLWGPPKQREWAPFHNLKDTRAVIRYALYTMRLLAKAGEVFEWWAHNGGNFDALMILEEADTLKWKVEASPAQGGRIVRMSIFPAKGEKFTLLDSFAVVPSKLSKACVDFDLKAKKLFDGDDYKGDMRKLSRARLEAGCRADCEAVLELTETVETHLESWGGKLKATFSSTALTAAKHAAGESVGGLPIIPPWINEWCRNGYHGGRVEVFHHKPPDILREYDVTSSYPWSMSQPLPWTYKETIEKPRNLKFEGMVDAWVETPKMHVPVLPVKDKRGGLYFPTGRWRGVYTALELRYAQTLGVKVEPLEAMRFATAQPFDDFITRAFHLKETSTGAARQLGKALLNGAYGKFGEKPEKEKLYVFPDEETAQYALVDAETNGRKVTVLSKSSLRFQLHEVCHWPKHTNFAAAAYITARSRILLHEHLLRAGPALAYTDTDSIHAPKTKALDAHVNTALGGLKVEMKRLRGEYFAPKLYRLKNLDNGETYLASKGFPVNADDFKKIVAGERVFRESFLKVKGQLRRTQNKFTRLTGDKMTFRAWGGKSAKRCPLPDGSTRPWTFAEIDAEKHLEAFSPLAKKLASK